MKTKKFFNVCACAVTLFAAATLTSCVYDKDEYAVENGEGGLVINITTEKMDGATRATTDLTEAAQVAASREHAVQTMVVAIFDPTTEKLKCIQEIDMSGGAVADARDASFDVEATKVADGDKVAIAINAEDDDFADADELGTSTLDDFKAVTRTLDASLAGTGTNTNDKLPMYGEGTVSGASGLFTVNVTVYHMLSRVTLNSVSTQFNYAGSNVASAQFTLTQVFLTNVPEKFNYGVAAADGQYALVDDFEANTTFYQGEAATPDYGAVAGADRSGDDGTDLSAATYSYKDAVSTSAITADALFGTSTWGGTATPNKRYLYTLPNAGQDAPADYNDAGNQTCLVLKGSYKATDDAEAEDVYYAVNLHEYDATNHTVMPGKNYIVDVVIKGKGSENPYKAMVETANLTANITLTSFANVAAGVTFGNGNVAYNGTMPTETAPAIGDFLYSDGTWSTVLDGAKTPVGIVYSTTPNTADNGARFTHGYAVAVKDASTAAAWSTEETDVAGITNITWTGTSTTGRDNARTAIISLNDAWNNGRLITATIGTTNPAYPAFAALATYNTANKVSGLHNSGWYVPAIGELYTMVDNLANASGQTINSSAWDESGGVAWGFYYQDPAADVVRAALNARLKVLKDAGKEADYFSGGKNFPGTAPNAGGDVTGNEEFTAASGVYYWSSSEWSSTHALNLHFSSNGNLYFFRPDAKSNEFRVRPVLAF